MKYLPALLNEYNYFQRTSGLLSALGADVGFSNRLEHFLYRASCVLVSLKNMYSAEEQTVMLVRSYIKQLEFGSDNKIAVSAEPLFHVYAQIPSCLTLLVNMQNELLLILQKAFDVKGEVPSSLNKAIKKGLTKFGFSKSVEEKISDYWCNGGKYLRDVRDVNEHHLALVDCSFFKFDSDPGQIVIYLPDNPEVKSPKRFTYTKEIDAFETISIALLNINVLIESLLEEAGLQETHFQSVLSIEQMGLLETPLNRTLGLMINITSQEKTEKGMTVKLDTVEIKQVIPIKEGGGNISVRKMKTDYEIDNE